MGNAEKFSGPEGQDRAVDAVEERDHMAARVIDTVTGIMGVDPEEIFLRRAGYRAGEHEARHALRIAIQISAALLREKDFSSDDIGKALNYKASSIGHVISRGVSHVKNIPESRAIAEEARRRLESEGN